MANQVPCSTVVYRVRMPSPHCRGFKDDMEEIVGMSRLPILTAVLLRDNT